MCQAWREKPYIRYLSFNPQSSDFLSRSAFLAPFCRHESKGPESLCDLSTGPGARRRWSQDPRDPAAPLSLPPSAPGPCGLRGMGKPQWAFHPWPQGGHGLSI